ncbi:lanC-like protein GCR2 [Lactuca sativa]|nr:lanC-like protein GCR2 [Lactuca sativa]
MIERYLTRFKKIEVKDYRRDGMLHGRAGHLWACLFLNKHFGDEVIPSSYTNRLVNKMIENGRSLGAGTRCPLMYTYFGTKHFGASDGLAGILHVLMHFNLTPDVQEDVKKSLNYLINTRFPSGNYPSKEDDREDILVQWCQGASGMALTLVKAAEVFGDKEFVDAAIEAGEVVWKRGLLKRVGLCHGISGNTYVFLALYRLTKNEEMLKRAKLFACFLLGRGVKLIRKKKMHKGDHPFSLFEGVGGMSYLFFDMMNPDEARFPGYEL